MKLPGKTVQLADNAFVGAHQGVVTQHGRNRDGEAALVDPPGFAAVEPGVWDLPDTPLPPKRSESLAISGKATTQELSGTSPVAGLAVAAFRVGDDATPLATAAAPPVIVTAAPSARRPSSTWRRRWPLLVAAIAGVAILASLAILLFSGDEKKAHRRRALGPAPERMQTDQLPTDPWHGSGAPPNPDQLQPVPGTPPPDIAPGGTADPDVPQLTPPPVAPPWRMELRAPQAEARNDASSAAVQDRGTVRVWRLWRALAAWATLLSTSWRRRARSRPDRTITWTSCTVLGARPVR